MGILERQEVATARRLRRATPVRCCRLLMRMEGVEVFPKRCFAKKD